MTTKKTAVYLRISSDPSGEQLGVQRQREDCIALCESRGWEPTEYTDNDVSASSGRRRPAYEAMLTDIRDGRIGAVVAWDLDRLHRRPIELESFMALADERHLALATVAGDVDLSTAQGRLVARLKGSVAAHEIEHKRARQLRAAQQKAGRGEPQWRRAFGYLTDGSRQLDPATAPLVADAYRAVLAGGSITDVAKTWNAVGAIGLTGRPWSASTVSLFLRAPRNAGLRSHNGEIVGTGTWPALVDESLWRATQSVLSAPGRGPGRKSVRRHLLTGILRCGRNGCSGHLSGNHTIDKRITYSCKACRGVSIRAEHAEPLVYGLVAERLARPDALDLLKADVHDEAEAEGMRAERMALLTRLDEIADAVADGDLTPQQARRATDRVTDKVAAIDRRQQDAEKLRVFADLPLGTDEVADELTMLTVDRFRAVADALAAFVVNPVGKGHRLKNGDRFDPDRVVPVWR